MEMTAWSMLLIMDFGEIKIVLGSVPAHFHGYLEQKGGINTVGQHRYC